MTDLNHLSFVLRFEAEIANETIKGRTANNLPIDDLMSVRNRKLVQADLIDQGVPPEKVFAGESRVTRQQYPL